MQALPDIPAESNFRDRIRIVELVELGICAANDLGKVYENVRPKLVA